MNDRPDLLILDAAEAVLAARAAARHNRHAYTADDRRRAADLLRLAETRLRGTRRRLELGLDDDDLPTRIARRLTADGWLDDDLELLPAVAAAVADELDQDLPTGPTGRTEQKETRQ